MGTNIGKKLPFLDSQLTQDSQAQKQEECETGQEQEDKLNSLEIMIRAQGRLLRRITEKLEMTESNEDNDMLCKTNAGTNT